MKSQNNGSLLPQGEGHDCKDAGGRAKQEARAEDEGVIEIIVLAVLIPLTPTLSLRERELTGQQCLKVSSFGVHCSLSLREKGRPDSAFYVI